MIENIKEIKVAVYFCKDCGIRIDVKGEYIPHINVICTSCYIKNAIKTEAIGLNFPPNTYIQPSAIDINGEINAITNKNNNIMFRTTKKTNSLKLLCPSGYKGVAINKNTFGCYKK